ncbi:hypothetical protein J6590_002057 [Homalodisca vitripennis]|nr:hypothetical protein J6590_002057 [Homalodisca vitripennis]
MMETGSNSRCGKRERIEQFERWWMAPALASADFNYCSSTRGSTPVSNNTNRKISENRDNL